MITGRMVFLNERADQTAVDIEDLERHRSFARSRVTQDGASLE
jgi:hypothetical protein